MLTKEKKVFSNKEFRERFEPVEEAVPKKKYEPKNYPAVPYRIDPDTGEVIFE